jgi:hypothetical protein
MCTSEDKSVQKRLWSMGLVYDPRELTEVTTARPGVPGMLQMVSNPTLTISQARTRQLIRIW